MTAAALAISRRRLWPILVIVLVVAVVVLFQRHRPVEVEAEYVLLDVRRDLVALHVRWTGEDDGKVIEATYRYSDKAPRYETQTLSLPPDRYVVRLVLERSDRTSEVVEREVVIEQAAAVQIRP